MGNYIGNEQNNYFKAYKEQLSPQDYHFEVWKPWTMKGLDGNDTLIGGEVNDTIEGGNHNDSISGGAGDDILKGDAGNDIINGGTGTDKMYGGYGNDTFYVDTWGEFFKDSVIEYANQGTDTVILSTSSSYADFSLYDNVENVTLVGNAYKALGNSLNNVMTGNGLNNNFNGKDGNDTLIGAGGHDYLTGGNGWDQLEGGTGNDTLNGYGGTGSNEYDVLIGGGGADVFVLGNRTESFYDYRGTLKADGYAKIKDFNFLEGDKIQVHGGIGDYTLNKSTNQIGGAGLDTSIYYKGDLIGIVADNTNVLLNYDFTFVS
jgi:serralysin